MDLDRLDDTALPTTSATPRWRLRRRIHDAVTAGVEVRPDLLDHLTHLRRRRGPRPARGPARRRQDDARPRARPLVDPQFARIQCTADLLPADVVGTNVFNQRESRFEFRPGPIFANVVLVDEINRASPKTQSGLLECMQERRVTVDVHTHELARPFLVLATQNPVEYEGTYPLPEAQVDRFMVRAVARLPVRRAPRSAMLARARGRRPRRRARAGRDAPPTCSPPRTRPRRVHASDALRAYVVALLGRTREDPRVELGASPRAGLMLLRAAKARALLRGRDHALPDDVQALAPAVLAHRIVLAPEAMEATGERVVADALAATPAL